MSKNRDLSYARLIKKIQQTTKELTATKNGQSLFKSNIFKTGQPPAHLTTLSSQQSSTHQDNFLQTKSSKMFRDNMDGASTTFLQTIPENNVVTSLAHKKVLT